MKEIPANQPLLQQSRINPLWLRWFMDLKTAVDEVRLEPDKIWTGDATMTQFYFGLVNLFDIGSSDAIAYLPSVDSTDLYKWIRFVRIGTGKLTILAADSDKIEYSSTPGRIWCDETKRIAANLTLQLVREDTWAILAGTGQWKVS